MKKGSEGAVCRLPARGYSPGECPLCGARTKIARTDISERGYLKRERACDHCGWHGPTVELLLERKGPKEKRTPPAVLLLPFEVENEDE